MWDEEDDGSSSHGPPAAGGATSLAAHGGDGAGGWEPDLLSPVLGPPMKGLPGCKCEQYGASVCLVM